MNLRPLQIAFTALTLALVVSLSLWVVHASHEQIGNSQGVTLQVPSVPPERSGANLPPDPFAEPFESMGSESVSGQLSSKGLETATVSKQTVNPSFGPVESEDEPIKTVKKPEEPLELPAIDLTNTPPDDSRVAKPVPPADQLDLPAAEKPSTPAWLSVKATLEEEIEQLRQQQQELNKALSQENEEAELWKSQNNELTKHLKSSQAEITDLRKSLESLKSETESLKISLSEKSEKIEALETGLQAAPEIQVAEKPSTEEDQFVLPRKTTEEPTASPETSQLLVPPLPQEKQKEQPSENPIDQEEPKALVEEDNTSVDVPTPTFEEAPQKTVELPTDEIVPELTRKTPPPPLPAEVAIEEIPDASPVEQPVKPAEPQNAEAVESPYYEPVVTEPTMPVQKKRGLIYDLQDWFEGFHDNGDSCTDYEPICTESENCTKSDCTVPMEITKPTCRCPQCTASAQWIHEDEMLSYQTISSEPQSRGLIPQMKRWWVKHKHQRDVRYEPAIVGRPANATVLPAAYAE